MKPDKKVSSTHIFINGNELKVCPKCDAAKFLSEFSRSSKEVDGLHSWCRTCNNQYQREKYANTPVDVRRAKYEASKDRLRKNRLMTRYGISQEDFNNMFDSQEGVCPICNGEISVVDHDHKTGLVRGLLCRSCNAGLGLFKDDTSNLANAIAYLEGATI